MTTRPKIGKKYTILFVIKLMKIGHREGAKPKGYLGRVIRQGHLLDFKKGSYTFFI